MTPERRQKLDDVLGRRQPDLTVLAENLHKPRNFSALIRTCDAVGILAANVVPGDFDPRKHWRTSSGSEKWVGLNIHPDIASAAASLKTKGFRLVAAHISDIAVDYRKVDYTLPTALLMGTELFGVSETALKYADQQIVIPMQGMGQSLNVSVAASIVLYEAQRQRQLAGMYDSSRLETAAREKIRFEWLHPSVAEFCRQRNLDYPELDEQGEVVGELPRS